MTPELQIYDAETLAAMKRLHEMLAGGELTTERLRELVEESKRREAAKTPEIPRQVEST